MDQRGNSRFSNNAGVNSSIIPSELLNKCVIGRRGGRFTSILPSQLLTRGGVKKHRFVPNIPVRQEKPKEENSQEDATVGATKDGRYRRHDRDGKNRGRGRGKPEVVQLQGSVFGEGSVERFVKKERTPRFGERSGNDILERPKYTPVSTTTNSDEEDEKESLKKLFRDDFVSDSDSDSDTFGPVKLPLTSRLNCKKEKSESLCQAFKIKQEPPDVIDGIVIKKEPLDDMDGKMDYQHDMGIKEEKISQKIKPEIKHEVECEKGHFSDIFKNKNVHENGELLFFQFPDCLPRNVFADDDEDVRKKTEENENNECQENCKWSLKEMQEGYIGKLQVLKSGKVQLKIGTLCFDVKKGSQVGFLQQVARLNVNENFGDLHILGHVKNKVVCFPNLENLTNGCA